MSYTRHFAEGMIEDKTGVLLPKQVTATVTGATLQTIVTAVTGKRLRVISGFASTETANAKVIFSSNATAVTAWIFPEQYKVFKMDPNLVGWFESNTGEAIKATNATGDVFVSLRYVEVTP
jgi:hypothetical protein